VQKLDSAENLKPAPGVFANIIIEKAGGVKCPRCWNYKKDIGSDEDHPEICGRCAQAVKSLDLTETC
jgi:isoleucyl-tRNA synthetase